MVNKEAVAVLQNNLAKRLELFTKAIDDLAVQAKLCPMPMRHKISAVDEMLLLLVHHLDRLAFEKGIPDNDRAAVREEILYRLLDRGIIPDKIENKLAGKGIDLSADTCKEDSAAMSAALTLFLDEAADADTDYASCTQFAGETPGDESGLVNKLASKVLSQWQPADIVLWRLFLINAAGDIIVHESMVKKDTRALETLGPG